MLELGENAVIISEGTQFQNTSNGRIITSTSGGLLIDKNTLHIKSQGSEDTSNESNEILFDVKSGTLNINMLKGS